ncbi:MAG: hypothetical protein HOC23_24015 [Halieaceae bacterium]|jgi:uncharacterized membrane protein YqhA|nr:hypothetical protein [Halieaceae bacterium]
MLEKAIIGSRYLAMLTVIITLLCSAILFLYTSTAAVLILFETITAFHPEAKAIHNLSIDMLKFVDLFFIAMGLQIIATGTYKLFINEKIALPKVLDIGSFTELKQSLVKIASIVLLILFLELAVKLIPSRELLEYGIAIAIVIVAFSFGKQN